jgi:hypothetical protein
MHFLHLKSWLGMVILALFSVSFIHLMRLIAQEDFIEHCFLVSLSVCLMAILPSLHMKYSLLFFWVSFDATYASDDTVLWDKTGYDAYML